MRQAALTDEGTVTHASKISTHTKTKPIVVISTTNAIQVGDIISTISNFAKLDDVYAEEFGKSLVLQSVADSDNSRIIQVLRLSNRFTAIYTSEAESSDHLLPSGPYFLQDDQIHQAWRLYADDLNAFVLTVIPNDVRSSTKYQSLF